MFPITQIIISYQANHYFIVMQPAQFSQFSQSKSPKNSSEDISALTNPQDETLFKLPSISAKKHARKMLVNQVRSLGTGPNANLKALLVIILKIAYGSYLNKELIIQLQQEIQSPNIKLSIISNNPNNNIQQSKLKTLFVDYLDILTNKYQDYTSGPKSHGKQLLIENMLTQNTLIVQIMIIFLRYYLSCHQIPNAKDYKTKVDTKKAYEVITEIFDINCRISDEYFIFYDDSILISSHDGSQFVYGKFYQNEAELRRQQKLTSSTLEFLNMISANRNNRSQLLMESKNSRASSQNSETVVFQPDQFGTPTPSFQRNQDFGFANINQEDSRNTSKNQPIRIQVNKPQRGQRKSNFIGEVITNIQMIQSRHEEVHLQSTLKKQQKNFKPIKSQQGIEQKQRKNLQILQKSKNSNLSNSKKSNRQKQEHQNDNYQTISNKQGKKYLENNDNKNIQRHRSCRNQSFQIFQGPRKKTVTQQLLGTDYQQQNQKSGSDRRKCHCKDIAKGRNKLYSNLYSLHVNAEASPLKMKSPKSNKQFPGFPKVKKQEKKQEKKQQKKQQNVNSSAQFNNIFRKKQAMNSTKGQQFINQSPSSIKNYNFSQHPFLARIPSTENITAEHSGKIEETDPNKKQSRFQEKNNFNRNIHILCSPSNKNIKLKSSPRGIQYKPTNLKKSQTTVKRSQFYYQDPRTPNPPHAIKKLQMQQIGHEQSKKFFLQPLPSPKVGKMTLKTQ